MRVKVSFFFFYETLKIFNDFSWENHGHGGHEHGSTGGFRGKLSFEKMSAGGRLCTLQENPHFCVPMIKVRPRSDGTLPQFAFFHYHLYSPCIGGNLPYTKAVMEDPYGDFLSCSSYRDPRFPQRGLHSIAFFVHFFKTREIRDKKSFLYTHGVILHDDGNDVCDLYCWYMLSLTCRTSYIFIVRILTVSTVYIFEVTGYKTLLVLNFFSMK